MYIHAEVFLVLAKQVCSEFCETLLGIYNKVLMNRLLNQCCTSVEAITKAISSVFRHWQVNSKKKTKALENKYKKHLICRMPHSKHSINNRS